ncbi:MAG: hypothetical protein WC329_01975 [Candidatus Omnitrophota bacterium]|jgi:hypothetical protein
MNEYKQYRRKQIAELADYSPDLDMTGVSISDADLKNGSPKIGDKIARNPKNHNDRWLIAKDYFNDNFSPKPNVKVICLCGSTRFTPEMMQLTWEYAKLGILAIGWFVRPMHEGETQDHHLAEKEGVAELFDELHFRKIDLADEVMVLNIGGYIGNSTRSEINYASSIGKPVKYLETIVTGREGIVTSL